MPKNFSAAPKPDSIRAVCYTSKKASKHREVLQMLAQITYTDEATPFGRQQKRERAEEIRTRRKKANQELLSDDKGTRAKEAAMRRAALQRQLEDNRKKLLSELEYKEEKDSMRAAAAALKRREDMSNHAQMLADAVLEDERRMRFIFSVS